MSLQCCEACQSRHPHTIKASKNSSTLRALPCRSFFTISVNGFIICNIMTRRSKTLNTYFQSCSLRDRLKKLTAERDSLENQLKNEKDERDLYKVTKTFHVKGLMRTACFCL